LSCSGAPLFDGDGKLVGVLDVSCFDPQLSEHAHALTGSLTIAAARAIEERLFREQFRREWIVAISPQEDSGAPVLIAVDRERSIAGANRAARVALSNAGHPFEPVLGLWTVFARDERLFRRKDEGDVSAQLTPLKNGEPWSAIVTPPPSLCRAG
jgi:transcriptional regulator of acetoin/glycerol metabolism